MWVQLLFFYDDTICEVNPSVLSVMVSFIYHQIWYQNLSLLIRRLEAPDINSAVTFAFLLTFFRWCDRLDNL